MKEFTLTEMPQFKKFEQTLKAINGENYTAESNYRSKENFKISFQTAPSSSVNPSRHFILIRITQ
jgi:hypothetical protein